MLTSFLDNKNQLDALHCVLRIIIENDIYGNIMSYICYISYIYICIYI